MMCQHLRPSMTAPPLEARLRRLLAAASARDPLPATRTLGRRLRVSHTTVFRTLQRLVSEGVAWQHTSGRFYPAAARAALERRKPVACLIRRLELCSELYREILEGISASCGAARRTMLLWHDELLVDHPDPAAPPQFAAPLRQRAILDDFLERHGPGAGGFMLDHVWSDDVLRDYAPRLDPAVVLFRRCAVQGMRSACADFSAGAMQALAHLIGRGYERIVPVEPFSGDPAVDQVLAAFEESARALGCERRLARRARAATGREQAALVAQLRRGRQRTALLCPEDNIARLLHGAVAASGLRCPEQVGVLTVMGTDGASEQGLSCVRYDFRAMGRRAVELLDQPAGRQEVIQPALVRGNTT